MATRSHSAASRTGMRPAPTSSPAAWPRAMIAATNQPAGGAGSNSPDAWPCSTSRVSRAASPVSGTSPSNGRIKEWAVTSAPADHAGILNRWEAFNYARTAAAFAAFALLILLTLRRDEPVRHPTSRR